MAWEGVTNKDQGVSSRHETKSKYMFSKCPMSRTDPINVLLMFLTWSIFLIISLLFSLSVK
jgi:hypothetical protein